MSALATRVGAGLTAGAAGTVALALAAPLERWWLGRTPRFAPRNLAERLAQRRMRRRLSEPEAHVAGGVMRAFYGPSWGALLALAPRTWRRRWLLAGVALALTIDAFEARALPWSGASGPLNHWPSRERRLLRLHTLLYGTVTAGVLASLSSRSAPWKGS